MLNFFDTCFALVGAPFFALAAAVCDRGGPKKESPKSSSSSSSRSSRSTSSRSAAATATAAAGSARGKGERDDGGGEQSSAKDPSSSSSFSYLFADSPRKSWIVPVQLLTSALLLGFGPQAARAVSEGDVPRATLFFFALVSLAATQDIAVDGWALTLLSRERVGWASTCQTVGTNLGFFSSFTALLALGDPGFCARWVFRGGKRGRGRGGTAEKLGGGVFSALLARARASSLARRLAPSSPSSSKAAVAAAASSSSSGPVLWTLGGYLLFWGWAYLAVTVFVAAFVPERKMIEEEEIEEEIEEEDKGGSGRAEEEEEKASSPLSEIALAYRRLAEVVRLSAVQRLCLLLPQARPEEYL